MIELRDIRKTYVTGGTTTVALDDVNLRFRDSEFAAILGPSGSGKTTMLNVIGGLDHADSGDIVVGGVSTRDFGSKDWDTYRNHRIGFVFQSYNLIPHQTILKNVELALTLAGVGSGERRRRSVQALERVGLGEQVNKRPSQLSGGQMQRVAIARALVNDPDIVLADEPTGALDTVTGENVMQLLKEVSQDRLVVMVTHNPELAERYATRIVRFRDGHIESDSNPVTDQELAAEARGEAGTMPAEGDATVAAAPVSPEAAPEDVASDQTVAMPAAASTGERAGACGSRPHPKAGRASMSFLTALSLSFSNLMAKRGRTFMTAFAGSIGIIGIAAILALSNGVNNYIENTEQSALSSYPLTITKSSFDFTNLMSAMGSMGMGTSSSSTTSTASSGGDGTIGQTKIMSDMFAEVKNNDLGSFKSYVDSHKGEFAPYVNAIQYSYGVTPLVYETDTSSGAKQLNPSKMAQTLQSGIAGSALTGGSSSGSSFNELVGSQDLLDSQMSVVAGRWPKAYDEAVLVLSADGTITDYTLYSLGFYNIDDMNKITEDALKGNKVTVPQVDSKFTIQDALGMTFKVVPASARYQKNAETGGWTDMSSDDTFMRSAVDKGLTLKVVGVVKPKDGESTTLMQEGIAYTSDLTSWLMQQAIDSQIVQEQKANPDVDVFTGKTFEELQDSQGEQLDMGKLFTVDEDALKKAFSFDTSALEGSNMGSLDLSGVSLDVSGFDANGMQLDTSQLQSVFSTETMAKIMGGAPKFSLEDSGLADAITGITDEQRQDILDASEKLGSSFSAWLIANPDEAKKMTGENPDYQGVLNDYLATEEGKAVTDDLRQKLGGTADDVVNQAMSKYLTEQFAPYFSQQMQALMTQAAQVMATQLAQQMQTQVSAMTSKLGTQLSAAISGQLQSQMAQLQSSLQNGFKVDTAAFANAIHVNMTQQDLASLLNNYMNAQDLSYDSNMQTLGYAEEGQPDSIQIYPKDFDAKQKVLDAIGTYNSKMEKDGKSDATIQYSDIAGTLMSSISNIANMISTVLIAFVSISLVVSSIMIGIITYISVLERKKEIGILRAMGASRLNVASIFNAETIIEGLLSGVFAIAVVYVVEGPVNSWVYSWQGVPNVMSLPVTSALILIGISVGLTFIAGIIPALSASRRDPVEALRSE
jgi:putative ABC transport system permease protein